MKTRRLTSTLLAYAIVASTAALPEFAGIASAQTRDEIVVLGAKNPVVEKTYPPLLGKPPRQGTANINPLLCKRDDYNFCDMIKLTMDPQGKYELYSVRVSLSWPPPLRAKDTQGHDNLDGNDMTIGVWEPDPDEVDPTYDGKTRGAWTGDNKYTHPEVVFVGTDSPDPKEFYLIVNNSSNEPAGAINKGYTIRAEFAETDLGAIPGRRPGNTFSWTPPPVNVKPSSKPTVDLGAPAPTETIKVKVPGPDGDLVEMTVPIFIKSASKGPEKNGSSPVIPILIGAVLVGGAAFLYLFVWRRRRAA